MSNHYNRETMKRVRCQFCGIINYTKNLTMELVCTQGCNKYAKYRFQELQQVQIHDRSNRKYVQVYEVVRKSKPCAECGNLTAILFLIGGKCINCIYELPEGVMA